MRSPILPAGFLRAVASSTSSSDDARRARQLATHALQARGAGKAMCAADSRMKGSSPSFDWLDFRPFMPAHVLHVHTRQKFDLITIVFDGKIFTVLQTDINLLSNIEPGWLSREEFLLPTFQHLLHLLPSTTVSTHRLTITSPTPAPRYHYYSPLLVKDSLANATANSLTFATLSFSSATVSARAFILGYTVAGLPRISNRIALAELGW